MRRGARSVLPKLGFSSFREERVTIVPANITRIHTTNTAFSWLLVAEPVTWASGNSRKEVSIEHRIYPIIPPNPPTIEYTVLLVSCASLDHGHASDTNARSGVWTESLQKSSMMTLMIVIAAVNVVGLKLENLPIKAPMSEDAGRMKEAARMMRARARIKGFLRPQTHRHLSLRIPMMGCRRNPIMGLMVHVIAVSCSPTPAASRRGVE